MDGQRVLLIDLDSSGALSRYLGIFRTPKMGLDQVLMTEALLSEHVIATRELLDFVPSGEHLAEVEAISGGVERSKLLETALSIIEEDYDWVILDCPSESGLLLINAIVAAEQVLIPVSLDQSIISQTLEFNDLLRKLEMIRKQDLKKRIVINALAGRYVPKSVEETLQTSVGDIYHTHLHNSSIIPDSQKMGRTIFEWRFNSRPAKEFVALANDLVLDKVI